MPVRRVVVGHNKDGKSILISDGPAPAVRTNPLRPGHVFSVDPQMWVPEENLYIRYEDTVVVTETGVENFTAFLPSELADLEKLTLEKGVVQKVGPTSESAMKKP